MSEVLKRHRDEAADIVYQNRETQKAIGAIAFALAAAEVRGATMAVEALVDGSDAYGVSEAEAELIISNHTDGG